MTSEVEEVVLRTRLLDPEDPLDEAVHVRGGVRPAGGGGRGRNPVLRASGGEGCPVDLPVGGGRKRSSTTTVDGTMCPGNDLATYRRSSAPLVSAPAEVVT